MSIYINKAVTKNEIKKKTNTPNYKKKHIYIYTYMNIYTKILFYF